MKISSLPQRIAGLLLSALALPSLAHAQVASQPLEARVIALDQNQIEIDRGLADGLRQGDRVRFLPPQGTFIEGKISILSDRTATVVLTAVSGTIEIGTRAEAYPSAKPGNPQQGATGQNGEEHPPWEQGDVAWPEGKPLLAPIERLGPEDRAVMWSGRLYMASDLVKDSERDSDSMWSRLGADLRAENLFGMGGTLRMDVEVNQSSFSTAGSASFSDSQLRVDRFAYARGGDRKRPLRWQLGRFLQEGLPEFGVIDGGEASYRLANGHQLGASFGYLPILYGSGSTGDDSQAAFFYRAQSPDGRSSFGAGAQKSWHKSETDRDLLVVKGSTRSENGMFFRADAWIDIYDGQDNFKSGSELTRIVASAGYRDRGGNGWSINASQFKFPQLLQQQVFSPDAAGLIFERETRRASVDVYRKLSGSMRGRARLSYWGDQDDSGLGGELRWSMRDLLAQGSDFGSAIFFDQGRYTDALGLRLDAGFLTSGGSNLRLFWETASYTNNGFSSITTGGSADLLQHRLRGSWDVMLAHGWSLSLYLEQRAGDDQDSQAAGFYLQKML